MRRFALAAVITTVLATLVVQAPAGANADRAGGTFLDDNGSTHEGMIEALRADNITEGCNTAGTIVCPGDVLTRGQMASLMTRAFALPAATQDYFADDQGSVHEDNINRLRAAEITMGCNAEGTRFCPGDPVRRDQLANFLSQARDLEARAEGPFTDIAGNTHERWINAAAQAGFTAGCNPEGTRYCPGNPVRRDQAASFIGRAIETTPLTPPPLTNDSPAEDWCGVALDWMRTLSPEEHEQMADYEFWAVGLPRPGRFPAGSLLQLYTVSPFTGDPVAASWSRTDGLLSDLAQDADVEWTYPTGVEWNGTEWQCET